MKLRDCFTWNYSLPDGTNTPRQLTATNGDVTLSARYTPWGDTLDTYGTGDFTFGYFGGVMDAATGLLYVGNGQYYDPATGRFLTRDAKPNSSNPYVPWDPTGAIIGPLAAMALFFGRKRKRGKWDVLVIIMLLGMTVGIGVVACGPAPVNAPPPGSANTAPPLPVSTQTPVQVGPGTSSSNAISTATPPIILTALCPEVSLTPTPTSTATLIPTTRDTLLNLYGIKLIDGNLTWTPRNEEIALIAVGDIASRMGSADTFRSKFGTSLSSPVLLIMGTSAPDIVLNPDCQAITTGGCTTGDRKVNFASLSPHHDGKTARNNIVHELGHIFNNVHDDVPSSTLANLSINPDNFVAKRNLILLPTETFMWQLNDTKSPSETFADFFVAWTYDAWQPPTDSAGNLTIAGKARNWMNEFMATH